MADSNNIINGISFPNKFNPDAIKYKVQNRRSHLNHYKDFNKYSSKLVLDILNKNHITSYLSCGNAKLVYDTTDDNKVFKISILNVKSLDKMIREPLYMMKNKDICNPPINICVYIDKDRSFEIEHVSVNKINNINNTCIITWYEEKGEILCNRNAIFLKEEYKVDVYEFMKKHKTRLIMDRFSAYAPRPDNVGIFKSEPKYRWFDLRPI